MASQGKTLFVGPNTTWQIRALQHFIAKGLSYDSRATLELALDVVKADRSIKYLVLSDEGNEKANFPLVSRILKAREDLQVLVLTGEHLPIDVTTTYMQLGQRDGGKLLVTVCCNPYNYFWLEQTIAAALA